MLRSKLKKYYKSIGIWIAALCIISISCLPLFAENSLLPDTAVTNIPDSSIQGATETSPFFETESGFESIIPSLPDTPPPVTAPQGIGSETSFIGSDDQENIIGGVLGMIIAIIVVIAIIVLIVLLIPKRTEERSSHNGSDERNKDSKDRH